MSYEALCVLCEVKGWAVCLSAKHGGPDGGASDPCYLHAISIWFDRADWLTHSDKAPIVVSVGNGSLDAAADIIETVFREGGVLK